MGAAVTRCPTCSTRVAREDRFCSQCGADLKRRVVEPGTQDRGAQVVQLRDHPPLRSKMLTENKHVSVLFADVCDSTALLQHSDPEEARNYLGKALNQLAEAVETYGGTVSQLLGDGLVALFGAPLAQEDHALRACLAALKMQRATVPGHDVQGVASPTLRIGINSGEVLVGVNTIGRTTEQMARRFTLRPGSKRWHRPAAF